MNWTLFEPLSYIAICVWLIGLACLLFDRKPIRTIGHLSVITGILALIAFTCGLWIFLERPPLRTLGETRLWYSVFLSIFGYIVYLRKKYFWLLGYCLAMAVLFIGLNIMKPELHDKDLMPALQSPWFVPHVVVYLIAYALLAASAMTGFLGLLKFYRKQKVWEMLHLSDNIVYVGFAFLTLGLLFGALWAKEAWGHYWTWDPKEVWALITWLLYLLYIHLRYMKRSPEWSFWSLIIAFIVLLVCWFGVNYLPTAGNSVHTYTG